MPGDGGSRAEHPCIPLSLDACLREAAPAKAGERCRVRVDQAKGIFKEKTSIDNWKEMCVKIKENL
jgi:hypothetical protein